MNSDIAGIQEVFRLIWALPDRDYGTDYDS
jgi:hypothetical protein